MAHLHGGHGHDHGPSLGEHGHPHPGHAGSDRRRLLVVMALGAVMLGVEVVGGFLANSLVLLSDAAHLSTDVAALGLAYLAMQMGARAPTDRKTYGFRRAEVVAAFLNALLLWALAAWLVYEAWSRLRDPPAVRGGIVTAVGVVGLGVNLAMAALLHGGQGRSMNMRGAYLHVVSDALGSVAAIVAGVGIQLYGATWLDPAATFAISALILVWTWRLTRDSLHVLLEGTPEAIPPERVRASIAAVPGVLAVHDLHVWSITTGVDNLSAHVVVQDSTEGPSVVRRIRDRLRDEFHLEHVTIEVEGDDTQCVGCN